MFGRNSSRSWDIPCTKASEIPDVCIRFLATLIWQIGSCLGLQVTYAINRNLNMCKVLIESLLDIHVALQFLNFIWFHSISMFALREHLCKHDKPVRMTCHTQCLDFLSNSCQSAATVANWNSSPWRVGELDIVGEENWKKTDLNILKNCYEESLNMKIEHEDWRWLMKDACSSVILDLGNESFSHTRPLHPLHCLVFLGPLWIILNPCSFKLCQLCNIFFSGHSARGLRHVKTCVATC